MDSRWIKRGIVMVVRSGFVLMKIGHNDDNRRIDYKEESEPKETLGKKLVFVVTKS